MQRILGILLMALLLTIVARAGTNDDAVIVRVRQVVDEVKATSYPDLKDAQIEIKLFDSPSDYFQTRFTFGSYLFKNRLRYLLKVNRDLFTNGVPEDGMRAIIAHELGHVVYYKSCSRAKLLGLVRLEGGGFTAQFERATDLEAIARGYGAGLKSYRVWLYSHIPANKLAEKRRNYFSPVEIDALQSKLRVQPELMKQWRKSPPRSLEEIERTANLLPQLQRLPV